MKINKNQEGLGHILIAIVVVILIVGFTGFYVYKVNNKTRDKALIATQTNSLSNKSQGNKPSEASFKLPTGWKTISKNGITISYPATWDSVGTNGMPTINGKAEDHIIPLGYGAPYGYKYKGGTDWAYYSYNDQTEESTPTNIIAPKNVRGADSTIIIESGDGGCSGKKIGIAKSNIVYSISLPADCETIEENPKETGIADKVLMDYLPTIIDSIRLN
ncbi:MAG TPA: hypothetical protein VLF39_04590 [Candidatus Saccharimonadales bacterium]|nr:hypothetical protein [Candidatus Saccharimonadales bacterium]